MIIKDTTIIPITIVHITTVMNRGAIIAGITQDLAIIGTVIGIIENKQVGDLVAYLTSRSFK